MPEEREEEMMPYFLKVKLCPRDIQSIEENLDRLCALETDHLSKERYRRTAEMFRKRVKHGIKEKTETMPYQHWVYEPLEKPSGAIYTFVKENEALKQRVKELESMLENARTIYGNVHKEGMEIGWFLENSKPCDEDYLTHRAKLVQIEEIK